MSWFIPCSVLLKPDLIVNAKILYKSSDFWLLLNIQKIRLCSGVAPLAGVEVHLPPLKGLLFFSHFNFPPDQLLKCSSAKNSCPDSCSLLILPLEGEISIGWLCVVGVVAKLENMISASIANIINAHNQLILNSLSLGTTW